MYLTVNFIFLYLYTQIRYVFFDRQFVIYDLLHGVSLKSNIKFTYFDKLGSLFGRKNIKKLMILDIKCVIFNTLFWQNNSPILRK